MFIVVLNVSIVTLEVSGPELPWDQTEQIRKQNVTFRIHKSHNNLLIKDIRYTSTKMKLH